MPNNLHADQSDMMMRLSLFDDDRSESWNRGLSGKDISGASPTCSCHLFRPLVIRKIEITQKWQKEKTEAAQGNPVSSSAQDAIFLPCFSARQGAHCDGPILAQRDFVTLENLGKEPSVFLEPVAKTSSTSMAHAY